MATLGSVLPWCMEGRGAVCDGFENTLRSIEPIRIAPNLSSQTFLSSRDVLQCGEDRWTALIEIVQRWSSDPQHGAEPCGKILSDGIAPRSTRSRTTLRSSAGWLNMAVLFSDGTVRLVTGVWTGTGSLYQQ